MARQRKKKSRGNLAGYMIIGVLVVTIGGIIYSFISVSFNLVKRDKMTLCRKDGNFSRHIILLDVTDKYSLIQYKNIRSEIEKTADTLALEEQLKLYFITDTIVSGVKPVIEVCNPGRGENASSISSNPKALKKRWEDKLYKPLEKILAKINSNDPSKHSPILETIQMINNVSLKKVSPNQKQKITIISDFVQNSNDYSFFLNKVERFWLSNYQHKIATNFSDIKVELMFVRKDGYERFLTPVYMKFWKEYFKKMGTSDVTISRIEG